MGVAAGTTTGASAWGSGTAGSGLSPAPTRATSVTLWTMGALWTTGAAGSGATGGRAGGIEATGGEEVVTSSVGTGTRAIGVRNHACSIVPTPTAITNPSGPRSHRRRSARVRWTGRR